MQKITPFLWFDNQAEEAAQFYTSIFRNSSIVSVSRYGEGGPRPAGLAMIVTFQIDGQEVLALNGGPEFKFTEAVSLLVNCDTQEEVDLYWEKLSADGEEGQCGWLKDRYGLWWQIVPSRLGDYLNGTNAEGARRAMQAMFKMKKLDIAKIRQAYEQS